LVQQATQIEPVAFKDLVKHARGRKNLGPQDIGVTGVK
jgi:hypothetical protein